MSLYPTGYHKEGTMSKILAASCKKGLLLLFFAGCVHKKTVMPEDVLVKQGNSEAEYLQAYLDVSAERDDLRHRVEQYLALKCRCKHKGVLQ
jgi:hypothetical protein